MHLLVREEEHVGLRSARPPGEYIVPVVSVGHLAVEEVVEELIEAAAEGVQLVHALEVVPG
eukprot:scaffold40711_cov72-Phaeocystis_antarctica.AAC.1